ncbi:hypothetical protein FQA39_LY11921 [Lamprigera yunnana]|nr:hypothetical protein FQA39_LY11921 [Lamprigera yunnana]
MTPLTSPRPHGNIILFIRGSEYRNNTIGDMGIEVAANVTRPYSTPRLYRKTLNSSLCTIHCGDLFLSKATVAIAGNGSKNNSYIVTDEDRDIETSVVFVYYNLLFMKSSSKKLIFKFIMTAKLEPPLKILIAKKEQYFLRIQRLFENSKDLSNKDKIHHFKIRY